MMALLSAPLQQTWDLDLFFEGGSSSSALADYLRVLEERIEGLRRQAEGLAGLDFEPATDQWHEMLESLQQMQAMLLEAASFVCCLTSQDVRDEKARLLMGRINQAYAALGSVKNLLDARIMEVPELSWQRFLADERIRPIEFPLDERRRRAAGFLPPAQEMLLSDLSVDGYHGWYALYETIIGRMTIPFETENGRMELSVGQASNKFSHPDRTVRSRLFADWQEAWSREGETLGQVLNHIAGYRLSLYGHRSWGSVLKEPLEENRMSEGTLWAMWEAVAAGKPKLAAFLRRKARLLGYEAMNWYDLAVRLGSGDRKVSYEEAAQFLVDQFRGLCPRMSDFVAHAFANRWIEAEDRPFKTQGGFCINFPLTRQSRIFLTFGGERRGVTLLAHELGHAHHDHVVFDLPLLAQKYAMSVAETASTFAESIAANAAIEQATSVRERLILLDEKISTSVTYLMNVHARFLFEMRFYEARKKGPLSVQWLDETMLSCLQEGYQDSLASYFPKLWAARNHFFSTVVPFYNFPYTFGYLFSLGLFARAREEGPAFEKKYVALLRDTGRARVEEMAHRHLDIDLTRPDFWHSAVNTVLTDVDEFLKLSEMQTSWE